MLTRVTRPARLAITAGIVVLLASPARTQSDAGAIASGSVAAAVLDSGTNASGTSVSVAGSLGYRFNRVIGLGVEVTYIPCQRRCHRTLRRGGQLPFLMAIAKQDGKALPQ
jgi:hypothetical protein